MEYLLDTHTFLWALQDNKNLPSDIKSLIENRENDVFVSYVSLWEIEIKHLKNPKLMPICVKDILNIVTESGIRLLPINYTHFLELRKVEEEHIHSDPFDHMIIATAESENMTIITHDNLIGKYQNVEVVLY